MRLTTAIILPSAGLAVLGIVTHLGLLAGARTMDVSAAPASDVSVTPLVGLVAGAIALHGAASVAVLAIVVHRIGLLNRIIETMPSMMTDLLGGGAVPEAGARRDALGAAIRGLARIARSIRLQLDSVDELERLALTDPLTGLPNRRGLLAFVDRANADSATWGDTVRIGVMHIDLDHFKAINDRHGHDAGDNVLREAARRMATAIRDSDILARVGGDEFVIVAPGIAALGDLDRLARRIREQIGRPLYYGEKVCTVSASIGIALGGRRTPAIDAKRLLINADMALIKAKAEGRNRSVVYTAALASETTARERHVDALSDGIARRAFVPLFTPVHDLRNGSIESLSLEVLWQRDPEDAIVQQDFAAHADEAGLSDDIFHTVWMRGLATLGAWRHQHGSLPRVVLRPSPLQLVAPEFRDRLSWMLDGHGLEPQNMALAVREGEICGRHADAVTRTLAGLSGAGYQIRLTKFGEAGAMLGTADRAGATALVCNAHDLLGKGPQPHAFLRGLPALGRSLGIPVVAEGVDTAPHSADLVQAGVVLQAGPRFGPPATVDNVHSLLSRPPIGTAGHIRELGA